MTVQNGLSELGPLGDKLKAMKVICPPHPQGEGRQLRACMNKRGQWWYYQSTKHNPGPNDWIMHRGMTVEEIADILHVYDKGQLQVHRGPNGCYLHYHASEFEAA